MNTNQDDIQIKFCEGDENWKYAKIMRQKYFFDNVPMEDPYTWTFNHAEHLHFILYHCDERLGYAHIQLWPERRAAIRIIVINETERSKSYGSSFLQIIENYLATSGYQCIQAESRRESLHFYEKNGYSAMPFNDPDGHESCEEDIPVGKYLLNLQAD
ncbi:MAG: hypothetical protein CMF50_06960 [Legionellales bacterium]|nr:hypothetical protein [Legionellales bacterium]|tara:strand:+ start:11451 stop:11924 length:474 start_codon:yes stop_codon:yes gene_type:complete